MGFLSAIEAVYGITVGAVNYSCLELVLEAKSYGVKMRPHSEQYTTDRILLFSWICHALNNYVGSLPSVNHLCWPSAVA